MTPSKTADASAHDEAERLSEAALLAAQRAEDARVRAEDARVRAEAQRQAAVRALLRRRLEEYPAQAEVLAEEEQDAHAQFVASVLTDSGTVAAFVEWRAAAVRKYLLSTEARSAQATLEPDASPLPLGSTGEVSFADAVRPIIEQEIHARVETWQDQRQAELDAAGRA